MMKWAVYMIRLAKYSEVGKNIFVGHFAHENRNLGKSLKMMLRTHKQIAEERGRKNVAGFKLHRRMIEVGPEKREIVVLAGSRSSDEVRELETASRKILNADLNEWSE